MDTRTPPTAHRPRVRVTLDDGGRLDARIRWWNRRPDHTWWALIEYRGWAGDEPHVYLMVVPASTVERVDGEDYSAVERRSST